MDIATVNRVLKVTGILLTLLIAMLAAHPAEAKPNNGSNKVPNLHQRVGTFRSACSGTGGLLAVSYSPNKAKATSATASCDTLETSTTCAFTNKSSSCTTTKQSAGPPVPGSVASLDVEITQADVEAPSVGGPPLDTGEMHTVDDVVDADNPIPQIIEAEPAPIQPVDAEPSAVEVTDDEDA